MSVTTLEEVFLRVANGTADAASRREIQDIAAQHHRSFSRSASAVVVDAAVDKVTCLIARFCAVGDFGRSASHNSSPIVFMDCFFCFSRRRRFGPYMFRLNPMLRSIRSFVLHLSFASPILALNSVPHLELPKMSCALI